jgi:hypothetical protein
MPAYDELLESIVSVKTERDGDVAGARILLTRGAQQLKSGKPYEAIRYLAARGGSLSGGVT